MAGFLTGILTKLWQLIQQELVKGILSILTLLLAFIYRHFLWRRFLRPILKKLCEIFQKILDKLNLVESASWFANQYNKLSEQELKEKGKDKLLELRKVVEKTVNQIEASLVEKYGKHAKRWTNRIKFRLKEMDVNIDAIIGEGGDLFAELETAIKEWFKIPEGTPKDIADYISSRFFTRFKENLERNELFKKYIKLRKGRQLVTKTRDVVIHYAPSWIRQKFRGREKELKLLDKWFKSKNKRILVIEAIGGTGKTMLTYHWLIRHVLTEDKKIKPRIMNKVGLERAFWWSIYESRVTFDRFLIDVLEANGVNTTQFSGKVGKMVDEVISLCQEKKMLFVLDGFERMLVAYNRMDAAYLGDETDTSPKARHIYDPHVARFVESFLDEANLSKLILTTRLMPSGRIELSRGIVEHLELKGVDRENAMAMLSEALPDVPRAELMAILERIGNDEFGYHPLTIALVVGGLAEEPESNRLSAARKLVDSLIADEEAFRKEMEERGITISESERYARARNHILHYRYNSMPKKRREFASRLAALRGSIDFELAKVLATAKPVLFKTDEDVKEALRALVRQRILMFSGDTYDFHPIVRRFFYSKLLNPKPIHERLVEIFRLKVYGVADPYAIIFSFPVDVQSLTDLIPDIELYHHLLKAGRYDEALDLFYDRLGDFTYYCFGAYQLMIQLLSGLFEDGEVFDEKGNIRNLLLKRDDSKAFVLDALANSYSLNGELEKAVKLFEASIVIDKKLGNLKNVAIGLVNLEVGALLPLGRIRMAEVTLRKSIKLCIEVGKVFPKATAHLELGQLFGTVGKIGEAMHELGKAFDSFEKQWRKEPLGVVEEYRALVLLMNAQFEDTLKHAERARELADVKKHERNIIRAEWLLGLSHLALNHLKEAEQHLEEALKRCRRISLVELEPDILLGIARLKLVSSSGKKRFKEAKALAETALSIAENSKYRLKLADIHNFLAELKLVQLGVIEPQLSHWGMINSKHQSKFVSLTQKDLRAINEHLSKASEYEIDRDIWEELSQKEREEIRNSQIPCDELSKKLTYIYLGACFRTQSLLISSLLKE